MSQAILFNFYTLNVMILIRKDDHCAVLMSQLSNKRLLMLMLSAFSYLICSETFYSCFTYLLLRKYFITLVTLHLSMCSIT